MGVMGQHADYETWRHMPIYVNTGMNKGMSIPHNPAGSLGGVGESVDGPRVGKVVAQVLQGALAGDNGLDKEAKHGEHGEAAILDLLHLELSEGVGVVSQTKGVEALACMGGAGGE